MIWVNFSGRSSGINHLVLLLEPGTFGQSSDLSSILGLLLVAYASYKPRLELYVIALGESLGINNLVLQVGGQGGISQLQPKDSTFRAFWDAVDHLLHFFTYFEQLEMTLSDVYCHAMELYFTNFMKQFEFVRFIFELLSTTKVFRRPFSQFHNFSWTKWYFHDM